MTPAKLEITLLTTLRSGQKKLKLVIAVSTLSSRNLFDV